VILIKPAEVFFQSNRLMELSHLQHVRYRENSCWKSGCTSKNTVNRLANRVSKSELQVSSTWTEPARAVQPVFLAKHSIHAIPNTQSISTIAQAPPGGCMPHWPALLWR
jgi:hypothetical protein